MNIWHLLNIFQLKKNENKFALWKRGSKSSKTIKRKSFIEKVEETELFHFLKGEISIMYELTIYMILITRIKALNTCYTKIDKKYIVVLYTYMNDLSS